jgi:hypothetical protein
MMGIVTVLESLLPSLPEAVILRQLVTCVMRPPHHEHPEQQMQRC